MNSIKTKAWILAVSAMAAFIILAAFTQPAEASGPEPVWMDPPLIKPECRILFGLLPCNVGTGTPKVGSKEWPKKPPVDPCKFNDCKPRPEPCKRNGCE